VTEPLSRATRPRGDRRHPLSDYAELLEAVKTAGLLRRRPGHYLTLSAVVVALLATALTLAALAAAFWVELVLAAVSGVLLAQLGFIAHEASHRQVFDSGPANDRFGRVVGCLLVGISYGWWKGGHARHHANPNTIGKDPSIEAGALVHTEEDASGARGALSLYYRHQAALVFLLLPLAGLNLHVQSLRSVFSRHHPDHRVSELLMLVTRNGLLVAFLFTTLPAGWAFAFLGVQIGVFGVCTASSFIPNHVGMPMIAKGARVDYLHRQVLTSRNIAGGPALTMWMGGLDLQIEHHLFPSMPRPALRSARTITKEFCEARGITYTEVSFLRGWVDVVRFLRTTGLRAGLRSSGCPTASQLGR
jgi:fatty acid desaturase